MLPAWNYIRLGVILGKNPNYFVPAHTVVYFLYVFVL